MGFEDFLQIRKSDFNNSLESGDASPVGVQLLGLFGSKCEPVYIHLVKWEYLIRRKGGLVSVLKSPVNTDLCEENYGWNQVRKVIFTVLMRPLRVRTLLICWKENPKPIWRGVSLLINQEHD